MGTVVQNKILMGLIFWTSWRVAQKKKITAGRTVFRFLGINITWYIGTVVQNKILMGLKI